MGWVTMTDVIMSRAFARANHWTFEIKPIKELIARYAGDGLGWADPFAGESRFAQLRNDMNPERNQTFQMEAVDFAEYITMGWEAILNGVLFDPPYSYRQVSEHYKILGKKATALDTSANFTIRVKRAIAPAIKQGGYAICCGWNTGGFGKCLGFELIEVLDVCHGLTHQDTLVTVERKL
jgi:hypothetical protein